MDQLISTASDVAAHLDTTLALIWLCVMLGAGWLIQSYRVDSYKVRCRHERVHRIRAEAAIAFARSLDSSMSARKFLIAYQAPFINEMEISFPEWEPFLQKRLAAAMEDEGI